MKKKNKRSYFRKAENNLNKRRKNNILKHIPKQPKLVQFLIDNEADEKFIKALARATNTTRKQATIREDKYDSICSSFTWYVTNEGHTYWCDLNDKFNKWFRESK